MVLVNIGILDTLIASLVLVCSLLMARVFVLAKRNRQLRVYLLEYACIRRDKIKPYKCMQCGNTDISRHYCPSCVIEDPFV